MWFVFHNEWKNDFASYANDNIPFFVGNDLEEVIFKLQSAFSNDLLTTK